MLKTSEILKRAKIAEKELKSKSKEAIDSALLLIGESILNNTKTILAENEKDCNKARETVSGQMIDRLMLNEKRISDCVKSIDKIRELPSPLYNILEERKHPNGMLISKISVPMGVVAIIYESRPNVTSDAAVLSLKSGNVCILRCGKEAYNTSKAIVNSIQEGLKKAGITENAVQLVEDTTRESAKELMTARGYVDLLIPRGGAGLIRACVENATVPCIETGTGICHIYVDKYADTDNALNIIENAKCSRPSVCNAMEVCLVHKDIANSFLPLLKNRLVDERVKVGKEPVELHVTDEVGKIISGVPCSENDFDTEFLDFKMALKTVDSIEDAIEHICHHSTHHSESIITENKESAKKFTEAIDSAAVYVNASTRFTDGGEFGLGCEMGISTQKMHARGPMGLKELTTYKYIIKGNGQIR